MAGELFELFEKAINETIKLRVAEAVDAALARKEAEIRAATDKLPMCYSEVDAAALIGLKRHQLRDERRRGRIKASKIVGGRIRYLRLDLEAYVLSGRSDTRDLKKR